VLTTSPLERLESLQPALSLELNGDPSAVVLNDDATQGVVVVDGTRLVTFDPATLESTGEFTVEGSTPITSIHYLSRRDGDSLLVMREGANSLTLLDAADPSAQTDLTATAALDSPITALTTFGQFMVVTDGVTIRVFSA
jgi:hypothetical protein